MTEAQIERVNDPLPRVAPVGRAARVICVRKDALHIIATEAERALLAADAPIFIRSGLFKPVVEELPAARGRVTKVARLTPVTLPAMVDHLSRAASWVKYDGRAKAEVATDVPKDVAQTILSRDGEWPFRRLSAVITTPTLRPDGTILASAGYDPDTHLLLLDPPALPVIPEKPDRALALRALALLDDLLSDFPFVDGASRSVALSALITPIVRGAVPVAPLHAISAPVAGSGKSFIVDLAAALATGARAPVLTAAKKEEENEKRLGAALMAGQAMVSIDNVNGELGFDLLCQAIERPVVEIRPLGSSVLVKVESRASIFATGNNIRVVGDMTRRTVLCSLDPQVERPELRTFKSDPFETVLANRGKYIAAALIICRAYAVAGYPDACPPLASFGEWSLLVRSALVWLGKEDPCATMEVARADDPETASLRLLLAAWKNKFGTAAVTAGVAVEATRETGPHGERTSAALELHEALIEVAEPRPGAGLNSRLLGKFLGRHRGRVVDGLRFTDCEDSHAKQRIWAVAGLEC